MCNKYLLDFEVLYNDLSEMILLVDSYGFILNINNTALDVLSYSRQEILNKSISEICCDKTLENILKCRIQNFKTNLCSKYKKLIPIKGKLDNIIIEDESLAVLKLFHINDSSFKNMHSYNNIGGAFTNFIKDTNGKYIFVNEVLEKLSDKSREDIINKFDKDVWDKELSYKYRREDLYVISTKNTYVSNYSKIINDEVFHFETIKSPMLDESNKVIGILGNIRDVTESVKLRNELVVQNEQLSIIYKILNNASLKIDLKDLFSSLYKDFKTLLNVDSICVFLYNSNQEELEYCTSYGVNQNYINSYINTDVYREFMNTVFFSKMPVTITNIKDLNNNLRTKQTQFEDIYYCACYPLVYNGECFGVINFGSKSEEYNYSWDSRFMEAVCKNISILLQNAILYTKLEENLKIEKESNELINLFFDKTMDFFCIIDEDKYIKKAGKHTIETLGYTEQEMYSQTFAKLLLDDDRDINFDYKDSYNRSDTESLIARVACKNGEYRIVDWNIKYLKDRGVYICSGRDLTYKEELENKRKIVEESLQLEKLKSEFLSSISHELRTPIAIIYGSILNMETNLKHHNTMLPKKAYDYIKSVKKNTFRLLRLFNNILDITNVDAGLANVNMKTHNIVRVIEDISLSVSELLASKNISLIFDTDIEEKYVSLDVNKMERVMLNLISNSVKYSKKGEKTEIFVKVYEENDKICISVKDNGIGIDETDLPKIFDRFNQINGCMTRNTEGSGIGLYLVKTLLQMQGINIKAYSTMGEGSEFIIECFNFDNIQENYEEDIDNFSVKIENFDMEFSDITY